MGLAASQARFLGLTARKSNIEYEGQQVNQQRTALAEEVNALYNSLAALKLPIAPDATEFYQSNYSFSLSNSTGVAGDYIVKNYYQNADGSLFLNTTRSYNKNVAQETAVPTSTIKTEGGKYYYTPAGSETSYELTVVDNPATMRDLINETYHNILPSDDTLYSLADKDLTGGETYYFSKSQMDTLKNVSYYTIANKTVTENKTFSKAIPTYDQNQRIASITIKNDDGTDLGTADVDTTRTYDSDGYDAALRDYTMSKDEYNKKVQDLNAKTESLQQEDKILEMRLDQISTEQNELKTELEAVKSILKDNIENTFNTFS